LLRQSIQRCLIALIFLTRLPVRIEGYVGMAELRHASGWFSLIGALIGAACGIAAFLAHQLGWPPSLVALTALATGVVLTGALHEDGLADVADAMGAGGDRDRALAIMRDSRIGSYGAIALLLSFGMRSAALIALFGGGSPPLIAVLVAAGAASRGPLPAIMRSQPPARPDGLGASAGRPPRLAAGMALIVGWAPALLLLPFGQALGALMGSGIATWLAAYYLKRKFGGYTGDTLGAAQQIAEIAFLLAACSFV
jgi:adenosylcobinamide-GDP ribazoletransferase